MSGAGGVDQVSYPAYPPKSTPRRPTWWSKAWQRAIEESAYGEADLKRGRALARAGAVGAIAARVGSLYAAVVEREVPCTPTCDIAPLSDDDTAVLVDVLAAEAGRVAALRSGHLPHALVEAIEEAGVELLPYGGELGWSCTCSHWVDPCRHALALGTQVGWLLNDDPLLLIHLRGLPREELLGRLVAATRAGGFEARKLALQPPHEARKLAPQSAHQGEPHPASSGVSATHPGQVSDALHEAGGTALDLAEDAAIRAEELLREWGGDDLPTPEPGTVEPGTAVP